MMQEETRANTLFVDYLFEVRTDGSIKMDNELTAKSLRVKKGDGFVIDFDDTGAILFKKVEDGRT